VHHGGAERSVGVAHGLGQAGRARAEDEDGIGVRPVELQPEPLSGPGNDCGEEPGIVEIDEVRRIEVWFEQLAGGIIVDDVRGSGEIERERHLGLLPGRAHRDQRTPELQDREERDRELGTVRRHDRDARPRAHATLHEHTRARVAQSVEVAEAVLVVAEPNGDAIGQSVRGALECGVQCVTACVVHRRERRPDWSLHRDSQREPAQLMVSPIGVTVCFAAAVISA
jgi:hypothetical protein